MSVVLVVALLWVLFFGSHVGLATAPLRSRLVARFGERGFSILFSGVAAVAFVALVAGYASVRSDGPAGFDLGRYAIVAWPAYGVIGLGLVLAIAGLWRYPSSNYAIPTTGVRGPYGISRITRHPFFAGLACVGVAHVLLAPKLVGAVFMAGLATHATIGARHQDRKLAASRGAGYEEFVRETSFVPFAAIVSGRQRLVWAELPWPAIAIAVLAVFALRSAHEGIFWGYGAPFIAVTLGTAGFFLVRGLREMPGPSQDVAATHATAAGMVPLLFFATAGLHAVAGFAAFAEPLAEMGGAGLLNTVGPVRTPEGFAPLYGRQAAFWFLFACPMLVMVGHVVRHALLEQDGSLLIVIARYMIALAILGIAIMPVSGFWLVLGLGLLVRRRAVGLPQGRALRHEAPGYS